MGGNDSLYSGYSRHFLDLDAATVERNIRKLESRLELFRLRLDLLLIERFAKGPDVLDFPIGTGRIYPHLMGRFNTFGYDLCTPYVERARALYPQMAERFSVNAFEHIEDTRQFDTVLSFRVLTRVKDIDLAVRNVSAIVKPGGRWIFTSSPEKAGRGLSEMERRLGRAGFRLVACRRYDVAAQAGSFGPLLRRLWPYWRSAIERGLVPFWAYRLFDRLVGGVGTHLFVAERST